MNGSIKRGKRPEDEYVIISKATLWQFVRTLESIDNAVARHDERAKKWIDYLLKTIEDHLPEYKRYSDED